MKGLAAAMMVAFAVLFATALFQVVRSLAMPVAPKTKTTQAPG
jgi:hypothetical protein